MAKPTENVAKPTGIFLLNLGGPDRPESVRPFLLELFRDPDVLKLPGGAPVRNALAWLIATLRAPGVRKNYEEVGGSPLLPRTRAQERALEKRLGGEQFVVRTAMRYWHPRAERAVAELLDCGCERFVALPLYPHRCSATTDSSVNELRAVLARLAPGRPLDVIESYARDDRYLAALTRCVEEGLARARELDAQAGRGGEPTLLFSAHGLPLRIVAGGDPYVDEIRATIGGVMARLQGFGGEHLLSFQSRAGPVKWLEPSTLATIERLASEGCSSLVVVPVSFVSDHIETVHEIDVLLAAKARAGGVAT
jgi:ferrochelatase